MPSRSVTHHVNNMDEDDVVDEHAQLSAPPAIHHVHMSDPSPPSRPKPGSLRDCIAAFEQKPTSAPSPPLAPRPKPGSLSQWKLRPPSVTQPEINRADASMSSSDAKESITKAGSLKDRMAALQGLGVFGKGPAVSLPPKPAEKPKWKAPPQVAVASPLTGDDDDEGDSSAAAADNKPTISPLGAPSDDMLAALPKAQLLPAQAPAQEFVSDVAGEAPVGGRTRRTLKERKDSVVQLSPLAWPVLAVRGLG